MRLAVLKLRTSHGVKPPMRVLFLIPVLAVLCSCSSIDNDSLPQTYDYQADPAAQAQARANAVAELTSDQQQYDAQKGRSPQQVQRANDYYNSEINNLQAGGTAPSQ